MDKKFKDYNLPDERGHFEKFGGKFVPEPLIPSLEELEKNLTIFKRCTPNESVCENVQTKPCR